MIWFSPEFYWEEVTTPAAYSEQKDNVIHLKPVLYTPLRSLLTTRLRSYWGISSSSGTITPWPFLHLTKTLSSVCESYKSKKHKHFHNYYVLIARVLVIICKAPFFYTKRVNWTFRPHKKTETMFAGHTALAKFENATIAWLWACTWQRPYFSTQKTWKAFVLTRTNVEMTGLTIHRKFAEVHLTCQHGCNSVSGDK